MSRAPTVLYGRQILNRSSAPETLCHLVIEGCLARVKTLRDGARQVTGFSIAGDLWGLCAGEDNDLEALGDAVVLSIEEVTLWKSFVHSKRFADALRRQMRLDAAITDEWMANLGRRSSLARVASLICETEARLSSRGESGPKTFRWPGTQTDFADAAGLSLVHVNKTLKRLRESSLISWDDRVVTILEPESLARAAGFDPGYLQLDEPSFGDFLHDLVRESTNAIA